MKNLKFLLVLIAMLLVFLFILNTRMMAQNCGGVYRWDVKTLTDKVAVDTEPLRATIEGLVSLMRPKGVDKTNSKRNLSETATFLITGKIIYWMQEADKDIHLAVQSLKTGASIVCEIPNPDCPRMKKSFVLKEVREARDSFLKYKAANHKMKDGIYNITGVLFYGKPHHAIGANDKHLELHPVIKLEKL